MDSLQQNCPLPMHPFPPKNGGTGATPTRQKEQLSGYILILQDDYRKVTFLNCLTGDRNVRGGSSFRPGLAGPLRIFFDLNHAIRKNRLTTSFRIAPSLGCGAWTRISSDEFLNAGATPVLPPPPPFGPVRRRDTRILLRRAGAARSSSPDRTSVHY